MIEKLETGIVHILIGVWLLCLAALLTLAIDQALTLSRLYSASISPGPAGDLGSQVAPRIAFWICALAAVAVAAFLLEVPLKPQTVGARCQHSNYYSLRYTGGRMRNLLVGLLVVASLIVVGACAPVAEDEPVIPSETGLSARLEMPASLPDGDTVLVQFTLTNDSDQALYILKWYTPLEGIAGEIFRVEHDGQQVPYTGILATRNDPTAGDYLLLGAGQSASAEVDLATSFDFSQPGAYTIEFLSPRISHLVQSEAEMARSVDDLGPVDIPSNMVTVEIGASTAGSGQPPAGDVSGSPQGTSPSFPSSPPSENDAEASPPLPHSMKGYELYSWYDQARDSWYFSLITSTDRLKTIEEILGEQEVNTNSGPSLTALEEGPLKDVLHRLPQGEHVIWISAEWLQQAGADPVMVETMRLPAAATVTEIEDLCRQQGLTLTVTGAPSAAPAPAPTSPPARTVVLEPDDQDGPGVQLVLHETPIVNADVIGPGRFEYDDQLGPEVLARIEALRAQSAERALAETNAALAPFDYRLASRFDAARDKTFYDLYRQEEPEPLLSGLTPVWRLPFHVSVNASGSDFVLVAENGTGTTPLYWLVNRDGPQAWEPALDPSLRPAYVGDALAQVTASGELTLTYQVELDGQPVYTGTAALMGAYMPVRSFTTWDGHWLLEIEDHLIMDGQDIGQALGYDAAFGFSRIGGQSFYFFERDGWVGISYGGQVLPDLYEQVFHNQCCEAAIHNVEAGPNAVWFHALRDGVWYWVEASLDGPEPQ